MKNTNLQLFGLITASVVLAAFTLAPLVWLVIMSISSAPELTAKPLVWWPSTIDFSRYSDLLNIHSGSGERFLMALRNSLITAITATLIALLVAIPAAFAFSRRGASLVLLFGFLATIMMPPITYILPLYNIFGSFNLLNSSTALAIVYCAMLLPFATWLMKSNFDAIPAELDQASMV
ncbi:MAG: carbohydrate ABC transporter permease, partial [Alphaproteobacteria bacterium]|nr:carbohydrate ABC transporter permease [Alphaproteobacteria bacterium]